MTTSLRRFASLMPFLVAGVLACAGCYSNDYDDDPVTTVRETNDGHRVRVRAPFTNVDVWIPKENPAEGTRVDVDVDD